MKGLIRLTATALGGLLLLAGLGCTTTTGSCGPGACSSCSTCGSGAPSAGATGACDGAAAPRLVGNGKDRDCCGCDLYDRCYPQRYSYLAAKSVNAAFTPQVQNGHVLDQTVWTYHFEPGTDVLTPGGQQYVAYLAKRRPQADPVLYLQTANDLTYDPNCPERFAGAVQELDTRRVIALQKFLISYTAGRPQEYQVLVHDPGDPSVAAVPINSSINQMYGRFRGGLLTGGGASGTSSGGSGLGNLGTSLGGAGTPVAPGR